MRSKDRRVMARVQRPLSDAELAKAEKAQRAIRIKQSLEDSASEALETLADAGDPEAREAAMRLRAALADGGLEAAAAIVGNASGEIVEQPSSPKPAAPAAEAVPRPAPDPRRARRDDPDAIVRVGHDLMAALWRQWRKKADKAGFPAAFRELALEVGENSVKFIEAGLFADMNDLTQCIQRWLVQAGMEKGGNEDEVNYRSEIESLKAELRGEA